jgi:hypothetical protein
MMKRHWSLSQEEGVSVLGLGLVIAGTIVQVLATIIDLKRRG